MQRLQLLPLHNSQPEEGDDVKKEGEAPAKSVLGRNRENPMVTYQVMSDKCKELSGFLGL